MSSALCKQLLLSLTLYGIFVAVLQVNWLHICCPCVLLHGRAKLIPAANTAGMQRVNKEGSLSFLDISL